jgi:hypothetical protein
MPRQDADQRFIQRVHLPRKVLLFSGHMIDAPGQPKPRFPANKEAIAAAAIARTLEQINAGSNDLAICGGANGGDLLFAEASLARQLTLELYIPFKEGEFLADFADARWRSRFLAVKSRASLQITSDELGVIATDEDPYEHNNLQMLDAALRFGPDKLDFICLWNGESGDGPGGTQHLMHEVQSKGGRTHWLDTTKLWN